MFPMPRTIVRFGMAGLGALLLSTGTLYAQNAPPPASAPDITHASFSRAAPGDALPSGWKNLPVANGKILTHYSLVADAGVTVIEADSVDSASALMHRANLDLDQTPLLSWRWKVEHPISNADNRVASQEDSPARLILIFDGDKSRLSLSERIDMSMAKALGGKDLPYATLMYIWSTNAPVGGVIPNPHTDRIQMIVVSGGDATLGTWQNFTRDVERDYQSIFHEKPGKLLAYGILTDSDNTHASARAWYGDFHFEAQP